MPHKRSAMPGWLWNSASATYLDREAVVGALRAAARRLVAAHPGVAAVLLFGSLSRGAGGPGSDADLLIVLESSPHTRRMDRLPELSRSLSGVPVPLDLHPYTVAELRQRVAVGDPFVAMVLDRGVVLAGELPRI